MKRRKGLIGKILKSFIVCMMIVTSVSVSSIQNVQAAGISLTMTALGADEIFDNKISYKDDTLTDPMVAFGLLLWNVNVTGDGTFQGKINGKIIVDASNPSIFAKYFVFDNRINSNIYTIDNQKVKDNYPYNNGIHGLIEYQINIKEPQNATEIETALNNLRLRVECSENLLSTAISVLKPDTTSIFDFVADKPATPAAPTLVSKSETKIVVNTVSGQEYSINGGITWQSNGSFTDLTPGKKYSIVTRVKQNGSTVASDISTPLTVYTKKSKPNSNQFTVTDVSVYGGTDGKITGVDATMEYSTNNGNSWIKLSGGGSEINNLPAGDVLIRYADNPTGGGNASDAIKLTIKQPAATPTISNDQIGHVSKNGGKDGKIINVDTTMQYSIDNGITWKEVEGTEITGLAAGDVQIRVKATDTVNDSAPTTVTIKEPGTAPTLNSDNVKDVSVNGGTDGKITGVTDKMQYSINGKPWVSVDAGKTEITGLEAGEVLVRYKEANGNLPSDAVKLLVKEPAATPTISSDKVTNVSKNGGNDGKITGVDTTMEYSVDGGKKYKPVVGNEITELAAGDVQIRVKETDTVNASAPITVTVKQPGAAPSSIDKKITDVSIHGGNDGKITGVDATMEYSVDGGKKYKPVVSNEITGLEAGTVLVRYQEADGNLPSDAVELLVKQPAATPTISSDKVTNVSKNGGKDGKITGVTDKMQYSIDNGVTWKEVEGSEITGLEAGDVQIRVKATDTVNASEIVTLTVKEPKEVPNIAEVKVTNVSEFNKKDGSFEVKDEDMEYSLDGETWKPITNKKVADLDVGNIYVRYAQKDGVNASEMLTITINQPLVKPDGIIDYDNDVIGGLLPNTKYIINDGEKTYTLNSNEEGNISLAGQINDDKYDLAGKEIEISQASVGEFTLDSPTETMSILKRSDEEVKNIHILGQTSSTITVQADEGQEYSIDGGKTWISGENVVVFDQLEKAKEYQVVTRIKAIDTKAASAEWKVADTKTSRYTAKEIAEFFNDDKVTTTVGTGIKETADNDSVKVIVDQSGNYSVSLKENIQETVMLPDDLGKLAVELNAHEICGNDGTVSSPEGKPGLVIRSVSNYMPISLSVKDSFNKGMIKGGNAYTGSGATGGNGIELNEKVSTGTSLDINSGAKVIGGNGADSHNNKITGGTGGNGIKGSAYIEINGGIIIGGNGGNGSSSNDFGSHGGNGGNAVVSDKEIILTDGIVSGGNGGNGGTSINGTGGNGGNGGSGIIGSVIVENGLANGGNAGNGGDSEKGNGGAGGNGGTTVTGSTTGLNPGNGGNGGNGGNSKEGNGGVGGNGGSATSGNGGIGGNGGTSENGTGGTGGNGGTSQDHELNGLSGHSGTGRKLRLEDFIISNPTVYGAKDGKIGNVNSAMEYSLDGGKTWHKVSGNEIKKLGAGKVLLRMAATDTTVAGESLEIILVDPSKATNTNKPVDVKTSDQTNILKYYLLLGGALCTFIFIKKRKEENI